MLAIESSGHAGSVAVMDEKGAKCLQILDSARGSAATLAASLDSLFAEAEVSRSDLIGVAVTAGPGSFTGIRVGITTAKAIGFALKIPVFGIDTLDALFEEALQNTPIAASVSQVWTLLNAYRGQLFGACWERIPEQALDTESLSTQTGSISSSPPTQSREGWRSKTLSTLYDLAQWEQTLSESPTRPCLIGPVASLLATRHEVLPLSPTASSVASLAWRAIRNGEGESAMSLRPNYLRRSAAEEVSDAKAKHRSDET